MTQKNANYKEVKTTKDVTDRTCNKAVVHNSLKSNHKRMNQKKTSPNGHPMEYQKTPSKHMIVVTTNNQGMMAMNYEGEETIQK